MNAYAIVDDSRSRYLELNQNKSRVDVYNGLHDALHPADFPNNLPPALRPDPMRDAPLGRRVILPSSHARGPRRYHSLYQNAMALVQVFQKPTLFITFTANSTRKEIKDDRCIPDKQKMTAPT